MVEDFTADEVISFTNVLAMVQTVIGQVALIDFGNGPSFRIQNVPLADC